MSGSSPAFPIKVRSTSPGKQMGLIEWPAEELKTLTTSYEKQHPKEWEEYLESESNRGFISNAASDHIMAHIKRAVPGLEWKNYRAAVVDFRVANDRENHFRMWQPESHLARFDTYWAYVKKCHSQSQRVQSNGHAEWTMEQVKKFSARLREARPEFWQNVLDLYENIGFSHTSIGMQFREHAAELFSLPEDIDYATIERAVVANVNDHRSFALLKPENRLEVNRLQQEWREAEDLMTFDEWRSSVKKRSYP